MKFSSHKIHTNLHFPTHDQQCWNPTTSHKTLQSRRSKESMEKILTHKTNSRSSPRTRIRNTLPKQDHLDNRQTNFHFISYSTSYITGYKSLAKSVFQNGQASPSWVLARSEHAVLHCPRFGPDLFGLGSGPNLTYRS